MHFGRDENSEGFANLLLKNGKCKINKQVENVELSDNLCNVVNEVCRERTILVKKQVYREEQVLISSCLNVETVQQIYNMVSCSHL